MAARACSTASASTLPDGQIVSVVGANGAGKSTLVKVISGMLRPSAGAVQLDGEDITAAAGARHRAARHRACAGRPPPVRRHDGLENLLLGSTHAAARRARAESLGRVHGLFPILRERAGQLARTLSGGEQQMLAIARGLMADRVC